MKERVISGITSTGSLTIGNYIGAIKNMLKLQEEYEAYIMVADLHALTVEIEPKVLRENRRSIFALYLALGIDPQKSTIFYQSDILEHTMFNWLTLTQTTMGQLNRMTQFKDKSNKIKNTNGTELIPTGLFLYPTLMAADIIAYNPKFVPVGIDQKQHLELTRDIIDRFNKKYKTKFNLPEPIIAQLGAKIMSLSDPTKKMSKSTNNKNDSIFLLDDPDLAYKKILKAVTDSENKVYLSDHKPGIKNLLTIYASLKEITLEEAAAEFVNSNYQEFKKAVAEFVKNFLINIQIKYHENLTKIDEIASQGAAKARQVAQANLLHLMEKEGLK
ncbi:tryptophan--tRNA ligase [Mycoplasma iguanae]|uniref:Tryptophan--tRNA ligase n=1 Tax=Mycoplasma iguanae TaxID=292461 RepID=A0ABY5R910_9MOLU|nr:tryptophan--tRNA ligase [Mycoplasma iguanae]UVD81983.1 tryptophan--tRNA ligase [Mycoplasma iguanae]